MAQWGSQRHFVGDNTVIRVLAHVHTGADCWAPATPTSIVDKLVLIHVDGDTSEAREMMDAISRKYEGCAYERWQAEWRDMSVPRSAACA